MPKTTKIAMTRYRPKARAMLPTEQPAIAPYTPDEPAISSLNLLISYTEVSPSAPVDLPDPQINSASKVIVAEPDCATLRRHAATRLST